MNRPDYKTEGVNRTKTMRVYPFVFTVEVPCKEVRTPMNSITFNEERDEETNYGYCNEYQPHAVKRMFDYKNGMLYDMRWDEAGNLGQVSMGRPGEMFEKGRFLFWTEDSRMHAAVDEKYYSYYAYDYTGERTLKLTGLNNEIIAINDRGIDQQIAYSTDSYSLGGIGEDCLYPISTTTTAASTFIHETLDELLNRTLLGNVTRESAGIEKVKYQNIAQ